jgi:hypothetical protein
MKQYMTGFERCCDWITEYEEDLLGYASLLIGFGLFVAWSLGGI